MTIKPDDPLRAKAWRDSGKRPPPKIHAGKPLLSADQEQEFTQQYIAKTPSLETIARVNGAPNPDEVAQNAWEKTLPYAAKGENVAFIAPTIAAHAARDAARREAMKRRHGDRGSLEKLQERLRQQNHDDLNFETADPYAVDPNDAAITNELNEQIRSRLKPQERDAWDARVTRNQSTVDTGKELGIAPGAVKMRMLRAREKAQDVVREYNQE